MSESGDLRIRVTPRSSRNQIRLNEDGQLKVWVTAAPTDGQANQAVCELLAKKLHVAKTSVSIVSGESTRDKQVRIQGMRVEEALDRLRS